jgi:hypothetical protein
MLYFSFFELIRAVVSAFVYGAFFGIVYSALQVACGFWEAIVAMPKRALKLSFNYSFSRVKECVKRENFKRTVIIYHLKDFLFVCCYGALFSILLYVTLDGVFRPFMAIVAVFSSLAINLTIGRVFEKGCFFVFRLAYTFFLALMSLLLIPPVRLVNKIVQRANK